MCVFFTEWCRLIHLIFKIALQNMLFCTVQDFAKNYFHFTYCLLKTACVEITHLISALLPLKAELFLLKVCSEQHRNEDYCAR